MKQGELISENIKNKKKYFKWKLYNQREYINSGMLYKNHYKDYIKFLKIIFFYYIFL